MDFFGKFRTNQNISRSHAEINVSTAARSGSNVTEPVFTNNTIAGNVHIIHNAPSFTGHRTSCEKTQTSAMRSVILKYKKQICSEYQYVTEYNSLPGEQVLLSERFTQPLILQKHRDQKEREEELRSSGEDFQQVLSSRSSAESVHLNSLFNPDDHGISPSAVILQGNSGNGKSFTVQKIMMDWASNKLYKERFDIVFHLKCKEINRIPGRKSLVEILSYSCSLTSDEISQILQQSPEKVLFIIDGFDELKLTQDHNYMSPHTDLLQKAPPEVTLCALLRGQILPESFLLVTTRSTATDKLSHLLKGPQRFSEIVGFSEKGVEEYFQKFFQNEELFRKAYTFVKPNETLFTACSIPVICWIICTTIKEQFKIGTDVTSGLETTTSIYVDFVFTLLEHHCQGLNQSVPALLRSLGQLAERGMIKKQVLLDEKTVNETVSDPAGNPFLCKLLFRRRICQETMFSFMHLSFQEFFTALYYLLLDEKESQRKLADLCPINENREGVFDYRFAHFAGVVQFAFGLLNKDLRSTFLKKYGLFVHPNTQAKIKTWILKNLQQNFINSYRISYFLHCLYELHEEDFVKTAMESSESITMYGDFILRRTDCWALLYCSQCCQCIKELILYNCRLTREKLFLIVPSLHKFKHLRLTPAGLSVSELVELMSSLMKAQTLSSQHVEVEASTSLDLSISEAVSSIHMTSSSYFLPPLHSLNLTFPTSELINIDWTTLFQFEKDTDALMFYLCSFSELKKIQMSIDFLTKMWAIWTLQISQNCSSLTELKCLNDAIEELFLSKWFHKEPLASEEPFCFTKDSVWQKKLLQIIKRVYASLLLEEGIKILQSSCTKPGCIVKLEGFRCNKQSQKCTRNTFGHNCNKQVLFHLNSSGFSEEILRGYLFQD